jgi:hypothetical protein
MAGRPSPIDAQAGTRDDGTPITVAEVITNALRTGSYFEQAAATAGVGKETGYGWLRTAGRLRIRARGKALSSLTPRPTAHERRCVAFSDSVAEAESSWEVTALAGLERLARGGITTTKTVTKRGPAAADGSPGPVLEVTTTVEQLAPSAQVLEWRLERRFPSRYGRRVEVTGAEGGPIALSMEERAEALADTLTAHLANLEAAKPKRRRAGKAANGDGTHESGQA